MLSKFGLTLAAAFGMLLLTAESVQAQIVTIESTQYTTGGAGYPDTTQPRGEFSTPEYKGGDGGKWRTRIHYGIIYAGKFQRFGATSKSPNGEYHSAGENVGLGKLTMSPWHTQAKQDWTDGVSDAAYAEALLQRSKDGGMTYADEGNPVHTKCKP